MRKEGSLTKKEKWEEKEDPLAQKSKKKQKCFEKGRLGIFAAEYK